MIRFARQRARLTQAQLGALLPMSRQTIGAYEKKGHVPPEVFEQILQVLNTTYERVEIMMLDYESAGNGAGDPKQGYQPGKEREEELVKKIEKLENTLHHREERITSLEHAFAQAMAELIRLRELQS